jgi:spermidine synthase
MRRLIAWPVSRRVATATAALIVAATVAAFDRRSAAAETIVHVERSAWQTITVADSATRRCLRFGPGAEALLQSCKLLARPEHLAFDYTRAMVAALLLWQPEPGRVLLIGVGGGSIPAALASVRPDVSIDAVDIDEAVLRIARQYFGLVPGPRLRLHAADGAAWIASARARGETFDAVLLDAFDSEGVPPALFSDTFLADVRGVLAPGGVFLANTFVRAASYGRETAAAERVFGRFLDLRLRTAGGNRVLIAASQRERLPEAKALTARLPAQRESLARLGIDADWFRTLRFVDRDRGAP